MKTKAASFLPRLEQVLVAERRKLDWNQFNSAWIAKQASLFQVEQLRPKTLTLGFRLPSLAVKVVSSLEEAVEHIEAHSTHHSMPL